VKLTFNKKDKIDLTKKRGKKELVTCFSHLERQMYVGVLHSSLEHSYDTYCKTIATFFVW